VRILADTPELGDAYLVGGCVRDWLLGLPIKDFDIEAFYVSYDRLIQALARWGRTDLVGRSFGVVKLSTASGAVFDFSIPRRDSKVGPGHKGFEISFDPSISPAEAATRRDYTINSLMFDPRQGVVLDFCGGQTDLRNRILRHTSKSFVEDPLRVLRGMQFAARFALQPAPETVALCRSIKSSFQELAFERVRDEWLKWAAKSTLPSAGLHFLAATEWLDHFPEINALRGTPQDSQWHPEGDVFIHTCHCCDALARLPEWRQADESARIVYMFAVLAHDFAKPQTTQRVVKDGCERIVSPGHEEASGPVTESFLQRVGMPHAIQKRVLPLVLNHMAHLQTVTDRNVRRLAKRLEPETIEGLCIVITADHQGRPPRPPAVPAGVIALRAKATELTLALSAPKPLLMGRHLIALGMKPGPPFGPILKEAFEAQLEGKFADLAGAWSWLKQRADLPDRVRERVRQLITGREANP
jgi:tRNA nucleotidyltransferase (CCA-adding enzyme)